MSNESFSDTGKEDAVREALGVEKKYVVSLGIPTTGWVKSNNMIIMAINRDKAIAKAKELFYSGECDIEGTEPEEADYGYNYDGDTNNWEADVKEAK